MKKQIVLIILLASNLFVNAQTIINNQNNKDINLIHIIWEYSDKFEYSFYYDEYVGYVYDSLDIMYYNFIDTNNIWQIGEPNKGDWNTGAYQVYPDTFPPKVLITDTINPYPINNRSWFDVHIQKPEWTAQYGFCWSSLAMGFLYKSHTDTLLDGVYIEVSFDGGDSFSNIYDTLNVKDLQNGPDRMDINLINISYLKNGELGISGNSLNNYIGD